ncbi:MAG: hypothetical protein LC109_07585 [Bacteroidia bacterium]|nr:hypothetical protein [Bacteroidia bacterium]MCO5252921.1 hypothetical protein [Bacteroidota bacterium]MCZ2130116.1 hypothetical protein [Bacteroidia bacterium]
MRKSLQVILFLVFLTTTVPISLLSFDFDIAQFAQSDSMTLTPVEHKPRIILFTVIGFVSALILFIIIKRRKKKS